MLLAWPVRRVRALQSRQSSFSVKPEVTFLLHPLRPALIKSKQQLSAGHPPGFMVLGATRSLSTRKETKCLHPHFVFESKLVEVCIFTETSQVAPQQGSDPESSICSLPLSAPCAPLFCVLRFSYRRCLFSNIATDPKSTEVVK